MDAAGVTKPGAAHLFRHTAATLMLEGGADLRYVQELLGHADVSTTQIYTRVSIRQLKAVHDATHPGARNASHASPSIEDFLYSFKDSPGRLPAAPSPPDSLECDASSAVIPGCASPAGRYSRTRSRPSRPHSDQGAHRQHT